MSRRRNLIVGNWKMNGRLTSGLNLARDLADRVQEKGASSFDMVICPPATLIWPVAEAIMGSSLKVGGQDCHAANQGAYTGGISAGMLTDLGCSYVILGHSERRAQEGETNELVAEKVAAAQLAGLITIVCIGETADEKARGETTAVITRQLKESLPSNVRASHLVVAYEPVWAIGSGSIPSVSDIQVVHRTIRKSLGAMGDVVSVLYGGSVSADNAADILSSPDVDGVLVGGASLTSESFWGIAEACS